MRLAKSNDIWREVYKRNDHFVQGISLKYTDVISLGSGTVGLDGPLSLICGENGVGKTTLLRLIHRAMMQDSTAWVEVSSEFPASAVTGTVDSFEARVRKSGALETISGASAFMSLLQDHDEPAELIFVDTSTLIPSLMDLLRGDRNRDDLVEGVTPRALEGKDLQTVQQLVGKDYERVQIFEIAEYHDFERLPVFRVTAAGRTYTSECMGTGELALLYLFWVVDACPGGSVLLFEEPESFVAPRSQRRLIDWIAEQVVHKNLFIVVSSHSGVIAERFPTKAMILCSRAGAATAIQPDPPVHLLVERLGILTHRRCLVLVEDEAAEALASALIRELEPRLHVECEVVQATSNGHITKALASLPLVKSKRVIAIGLYDGDQNPEETQSIRWPRVFLPGSSGPESLLRDLCRSCATADLADALGLELQVLAAALGGAEGAEPHDWLRDVCSALEIDIKSLFRALVPIWIESHRKEAADFQVQIAKAARRPF